MLVCQVLDLSGLFIEKVLGVGEMLVDQGLVLDVDEWDEEGEGCEEQS